MSGAGAITVLKLGGELLETDEGRDGIANAIRRLASAAPLVVVHGGGREVDADMRALGIEKRAVDGLRVTDASTLEVVVGVLAGRVNTRLVAALRRAGVDAVGLTGADADVASVRRAPPYRAADGAEVDLGFVGQPTGTGRSRLLDLLCEQRFVPVVASVGADASGRLLNVNADTLAADLAVRLGAGRLLIAGGTAGVLDEEGRTIPVVDQALLDRLIADGRASAGMVAKLIACRDACRGGVDRVAIVSGRQTGDLETAEGTRVATTGVE